ncbi:MAG: ribbon-helix-helix domain-containing protein [Halanaerobiaceae bacterium]
MDPEANRQLNIVSEKIGVSKASLIREGVNKILKEKGTLAEDPAYKLSGIIDEDIEDKNIASNHDYYLYGKGRPEHE